MDCQCETGLSVRPLGSEFKAKQQLADEEARVFLPSSGCTDPRGVCPPAATGQVVEAVASLFAEIEITGCHWEKNIFDTLHLLRCFAFYLAVHQKISPNVFHHYLLYRNIRYTGLEIYSNYWKCTMQI